VVPEDEAVAIELPAGGAAFFNYGIAHSTKPNTTERERAGLASHFLHADYVPLAGTGVGAARDPLAWSWEAEVEPLLVDAQGLAAAMNVAPLANAR
jgi:ectoine hydroxylase-related dioxygenase (phytanoyl-CoA dioxygenase family)